MRIAVIGATGRTGRHVVSQALGRGHQVVAIARRPEQVDVPAERERLIVTAADAHDAAALRHAVDGSEAIVSTLGAAAGRRPTDVYSAGISNLLGVIDGGRIRRLAVISAAPVGPRDEQPTIFRHLVLPILDRLFGGAYADMGRMERALQARDDLEWACLRPPRLVAKPAAGYRIGSRPLPRTRSLAYPDLAAALLDCAEGAGAPTGMLYVAH